jgi:non-specific serine/threonine protein kinase
VVSNAIYQSEYFGVMLFLPEHYKVPIEKKQDETVCWIKPSQSVYFTSDQRTSLKDLPELSEQVFYCDMEPEQEKLYEEEKSKARALLKPMVLALTKSIS